MDNLKVEHSEQDNEYCHETGQRDADSSNEANNEEELLLLRTESGFRGISGFGDFLFTPRCVI